MATPYDWRIDEIERNARNAAPRHEVDALRSDVVRLEHSLREARADADVLRAQLLTAQDALIQLQHEVASMIQLENARVEA